MRKHIAKEPKMSSVFETRQFKAGNSQAVRLPAGVAFPPGTPLLVRRVGDRVIVEPKRQRSLVDLPALFAELGKVHSGERPEFEEVDRAW
jgi:antitoxin VapB